MRLPPNSVSKLTAKVRLPVSPHSTRYLNQAILVDVPIGLGGPEIRSDNPATPLAFPDVTVLQILQRIKVVDDLVHVPDTIPSVINVTGNDISVDPSTITIVSATTFGTVGVDPNNDRNIVYTPRTKFFGNDRFTYEACEDPEQINCGRAEVVLVVTLGVKDDVAATTRNTPVTIDVTVNDSILVKKSTVTIIQAGQKSKDIFVDPITGLVTYTPMENVHGQDSFVYRVCDSIRQSLNCGTGVAKVQIRLPVNDDEAVTSQGTPLSHTLSGDLRRLISQKKSSSMILPVVLASVQQQQQNVQQQPMVLLSPAASDASTIVSRGGEDDDLIDLSMMKIVEPPLHGKCVISSDGHVSYLPAASYVGDDQCTYSICGHSDNEEDRIASCANATLHVQVMVQAVDDRATPPTRCTREGDMYNEEFGTVIDVLDNDSPNLPRRRRSPFPRSQSMAIAS